MLRLLFLLKEHYILDLIIHFHVQVHQFYLYLSLILLTNPYFRVIKIKFKINFYFSNSYNNKVNFFKINSVSYLNFSSSEDTTYLSCISSIFVKNFFLIVLNNRTLENIFSGASIGHLHSQFQSILKFLVLFSIFFRVYSYVSFRCIKSSQKFFYFYLIAKPPLELSTFSLKSSLY